MRVLALWPGLPALWMRGEWSGLLQAVCFGLVVNFVLVSTFVAPHWLSPWARGLSWAVVTTIWCVIAVKANYYLTKVRAEARQKGLFLQAQAEYLKGRWTEAERLLRRQIGQFSGDVDAHFMLASLYRRTRRWDEAEQQLRATERMEGAVKWHWEMELERRMLERSTKLDKSDRAPAPSSTG